MSAIETVKLYIEKQISHEECRIWLEDNLSPLDISRYLIVLDKLIEQHSESNSQMMSEELYLKAFSSLVSCMHDSVKLFIGQSDYKIRQLEDSLNRLREELDYCQSEGINLLNQIEMCDKKFGEGTKQCQGRNTPPEAKSSARRASLHFCFPWAQQYDHSQSRSLEKYDVHRHSQRTGGDS